MVSDTAGIEAITPSGVDVQITIHGSAAVSAVTEDSAITITDVADGDHIWFGPPSSSTSAPVEIGVTAAGVSGVGEYNFTDGQDSAPVNPVIGVSPSATIDCPAPCGGARDVVGYAVPPSGPGPAWWTAAPAQMLTDGTQIALPAWQQTVDVAVAYRNIPTPHSNKIVVEAREMSSADTPIDVLGWDTPYLKGGATTNGVTTATTMVPTTAFGGSFVALASTMIDVNTTATNWDRRVVPAAPSYSLDAVADMLPWISNVQYDTCTRLVSWSETAGRPSDGVWVVLLGSPDPEGGFGAQWSILARDTGSLQLPVAGIPFAAKVGVSQVYVVDVAAASGYDDLRVLPTATIPDLGASTSGGYPPGI